MASLYKYLTERTLLGLHNVQGYRVHLYISIKGVYRRSQVYNNCAKREKYSKTRACLEPVVSMSETYNLMTQHIKCGISKCPVEIFVCYMQLFQMPEL